MEIQNTRDIAPTSFNALIYAPTGYGKTYAASTIGNNHKVLILNADKGLLTLKDFDLDYITLKQGDELNHLRAIIDDLSKEKIYDTIFLDGLSDFSEIFLAEAEKKFPDPSQNYLKYGEHKKIFKRFLKILRDLSFNVILTAHLKEHKGFYYPAIDGSLAQEIPALMDFVFTIVINPETNKRSFLTKSMNGYICKARRGKYLETYEDMNLENIINKVFN